MNIRIALAGNPNSGKTTLFNALTGSNQFVGNWPGVTVEKKEGKLKIQISLGTDIYTVSKMLTHKNVSTTQIYADLVNVKKRETANKISLK